jgi:hypothetical protein
LLLFTVVWFPPAPGKPGLTLYAYLYPIMPAAGAVRAPGRVVLLLLIPAGVGLAWWLSPRSWWLAAGILVVCFLEQARSIPSYDLSENRQRISLLASRVEPGKGAFFAWRRVQAPPPMFCQTQIDGMWAQLETGVPTLNVYSGREPPGWNLADNELSQGQSAAPLRWAIAEWLTIHGIPQKSVQEIKLED